ncbi:MAG: RnfABCDGE type electron transport complex subunit G [Bacteroidales bacterium]
MAKKESSFLNMVITLAVITIISAVAVGGIYQVTKEPIEIAQKAKQQNAIKAVIPDFDRLEEKKIKDDQDMNITINTAFKGDQVVGYAVESYSKKGYDATPIIVMVGFLPNGEINNTSVIQQKETPGLGTKMVEPTFKDQFNGQNPASYKLIVKKDGGDVDAITAATISSRAFCDATQRAYDALIKEGGIK